MIRWLLRGIGAVLCVAMIASFIQNRAPIPRNQISVLTDRLFEFGAVDFVHSGYSEPEQSLFSCVQSGRPLTAEQSRSYRRAYEATLLGQQALFRRLDADLQLRQDFGMEHGNNVGTTGIPGLHDQHDLSALHNLMDMDAAIEQMGSAGPIHRAWMANNIYKDLTDLMVHLAPATHSVGLLKDEDIPASIRPALRVPFVSFYEAMKAAQAAPLNSEAYWQAVRQAKGAYTDLAINIQDIIRRRNGALLHTLSGNWLALQTVAPRLNAKSPSATAREAAATNGPCQTP